MRRNKKWTINDLDAVIHDSEKSSYRSIAKKLGRTEGSLSSALHGLRQVLRGKAIDGQFSDEIKNHITSNYTLSGKKIVAKHGFVMAINTESKPETNFFDKAVGTFVSQLEKGFKEYFDDYAQVVQENAMLKDKVRELEYLSTQQVNNGSALSKLLNSLSQVKKDKS